MKTAFQGDLSAKLAPIRWNQSNRKLGVFLGIPCYGIPVKRPGIQVQSYGIPVQFYGIRVQI